MGRALLKMDKKLITKIANDIIKFSDMSLSRGLTANDIKTMACKFARCILFDIKQIEIKNTRDFIKSLPTKKG